jgi:Tol biopolymer transport system component
VQKQIGSRDEGVITVEDWSPDARYISITLSKFKGAQNWQDTLQVRRVDGTLKRELEIKDATQGRFSPDGHWLAYADDNQWRGLCHSLSGARWPDSGIFQRWI